MFASRLSDKLAAESLYKEGISSVINAYLQPGANKIEKIRVMRKLFKDLCAKTVPECIPEEYCPPEWEESEIERIIKDLGMMCYENPMVVAQTRPVGAISSTQADAVLKNALKCGYSPGELERLLVNMYGKRQVNLLTKVEASQFLAYMRTPGAVIRQ
jgi:lysine-specific demethylase 8